MFTASEIFETNNLYRHLILFKLYIETNGAINQSYNFLRRDIKALLADSFSLAHFNTTINYLDNINYTRFSGSSMTINGVIYFENFLMEFVELPIEDQEILQKKLPEKVFEFFKFSDKLNTVMSLLDNIIKLGES